MTMLTLLFISVVLACGVQGQNREPGSRTLPPFVRPRFGPSPICCPPGGPKLAPPFACPRFQLAVGTDIKAFKKSCCQAECKCDPETESCCPRPSAEDPSVCELSCQPKVVYRTCPRIEPPLDRDFFQTCRPGRNPCDGSCSEGQGCCRVDVGGKCQWACAAKVVWKPPGACPVIKTADRCPQALPTCPGGCPEGQRCCRDVNGGCEWTCQEEIDPRSCPEDAADPDANSQRVGALAPRGGKRSFQPFTLQPWTFRLPPSTMGPFTLLPSTSWPTWRPWPWSTRRPWSTWRPFTWPTRRPTFRPFFTFRF